MEMRSHAYAHLLACLTSLFFHVRLADSRVSRVAHSSILYAVYAALCTSLRTFECRYTINTFRKDLCRIYLGSSGINESVEQMGQ